MEHLVCLGDSRYQTPLDRRCGYATDHGLFSMVAATSPLQALTGKIDLELPLFDRTVGYCAWARMNSLGERILSPE